jgi:ABC-type uncharacterized transport system fused permease/ATPase subunit
VLDEATSALDPDSQDKLMELLTTELDERERVTTAVIGNALLRAVQH